MIIKILGILDIFVAACFWIFGILGWIPSSFVLVLGLFLLVKGIVFITGFAVGSILDIASAIIIISATSIEMPNLVVILVTLFLLQKGIFSMVS